MSGSAHSNPWAHGLRIRQRAEARGLLASDRADPLFAGARFNVECVPRLPTFPARWVLEDLRGRPYFVFWVTDAGSLRDPLRLERVDGGKAVRVTTPTGTGRRIEIVRRPSPNGTGTVHLYQCPICEKPRRYVYPLAASGGRLVDCFGPQCQACAKLRWARAHPLRSPGGDLRAVCRPIHPTIPMGPAGGVRPANRRRRGLGPRVRVGERRIVSPRAIRMTVNGVVFASGAPRPSPQSGQRRSGSGRGENPDASPRQWSRRRSPGAMPD